MESQSIAYLTLAPTYSMNIALPTLKPNRALQGTIAFSTQLKHRYKGTPVFSFLL